MVLVNIAAWGETSQSSASKWSKAQDARGLVVPSDRDFSHHTDYEQNPWWCVKFRRAEALHRIEIEQRKDAQHRSDLPIRVLTSMDGSDWQEAFCSTQNDDATSDLLVIPIGATTAKTVKIELVGHGALVLRAVRIFAEKEARPVFFHERDDGLGSRLRSLLNAMILTQMYDGSLSFSWTSSPAIIDKFHDIREANDTFSKEFCERHEVAPRKKQTDALQTLHGFLENPDEGNGSVLIDQNVPLNRAAKPWFGWHVTSDHYKQAFDKIEFSDDIREAIELAKAAQLPQAFAAIHVRGGDIFEEVYRHYSLFVDKVCTIPVASLLAQHEVSNGQDVVLICQEADAARSIADFVSDPKVHILEQPELSGIQQAFFDIIVMARCSKLFAGRSHFSHLASDISGTAISDPLKAVDTGELLRFLSDPFRIKHLSDMHASYSHWSCYRTKQSALSPIERKRLIEQALHLDPDNPIYRICFALSLYEVDGAAKAINELERTMKDLRIGDREKVDAQHRRFSFSDYEFSVLGRLALMGSKEAQELCTLCDKWYN